MNSIIIHRFAITASFMLLLQFTAYSQCTLADNYTNTAEFQAAIDAAVTGGCINTFLTGTAQFSGTINIPGATTLVVSGTATLNGAGGSIVSANSISIQAGGSITGVSDGDITVGGNALTGLPATINGPNTITSSGLPVELVSFISKTSDDKVYLTWQTASEINNEKFVIERSANGHDFFSIGEVEGAGNSLDFSGYQFIDERPLTGKNYYRLKQMDFNGASEYSQVRLAVLDMEAHTSVYPTISNSTFTVKSEEDEINSISLFNLQGQLLDEIKMVGNLVETFDFSSQPAGAYLLYVKTERGSSQHRIFLAK